MESPQASIRVINDNPLGARPSPRRMREASERLEQLGFETLRIGRFAIDVQAPASTYESALGRAPAPAGEPSVAISPNDERLRSLVDAMERAPIPPTL